jgi:hypothetical protein
MTVCRFGALAPFVVPGSQRWIVYRVLDASAG